MSRYSFWGRAVDSFGNIKVGEGISIYLEGTSTAAIVYEEQTGGTGISTAPQVTTDSGGRFNFWLDEGDYSLLQLFDIKVGSVTYDKVDIFRAQSLNVFSDLQEDIRAHLVSASHHPAATLITGVSGAARERDNRTIEDWRTNTYIPRKNQVNTWIIDLYNRGNLQAASVSAAVDDIHWKLFSASGSGPNGVHIGLLPSAGIIFDNLRDRIATLEASAKGEYDWIRDDYITRDTIVSAGVDSLRDWTSEHLTIVSAGADDIRNDLITLGISANNRFNDLKNYVDLNDQAVSGNMDDLRDDLITLGISANKRLEAGDRVYSRAIYRNPATSAARATTDGIRITNGSTPLDIYTQGSNGYINLKSGEQVLYFQVNGNTQIRIQEAGPNNLQFDGTSVFGWNDNGVFVYDNSDATSYFQVGSNNTSKYFRLSTVKTGAGDSWPLQFNFENRGATANLLELDPRRGIILRDIPNTSYAEFLIGREPAVNGDLIISSTTNNIHLSAGITQTQTIRVKNDVSADTADIYIGKDLAVKDDTVIYSTNDMYLSAGDGNAIHLVAGDAVYIWDHDYGQPILIVGNQGDTSGQGEIRIQNNATGGSSSLKLYAPDDATVSYYNLNCTADNFNITATGGGVTGTFSIDGINQWAVIENYSGGGQLKLGTNDYGNFFIGREEANLNDLVIYSTNDIRVSGGPANSGTIYIPTIVHVGSQNWGNAASVYLHGGNSTGGPLIQLQRGSGGSSPITNFDINSGDGYLTIGPSTDSDALKFYGTRDRWQFTNNQGFDLGGTTSPLSNFFIGKGDIISINDLIINATNSIHLSAGGSGEGLYIPNHIAIGNRYPQAALGDPMYRQIDLGLNGSGYDYLINMGETKSSSATLVGIYMQLVNSDSGGSAQTNGITVVLDNPDTADGTTNYTDHICIDAYTQGTKQGVTGNSNIGVRAGVQVTGDNTTITDLIAGYFYTTLGTNMVNTTFTNMIGVDIDLFRYGSGQVSITDAYGLRIQEFPVNPTGTTENLYGLYIGDQSPGGFDRHWNLYSAGANSRNYFAGSVSAGNLTVEGDLEVLGSIDLPENQSGQETLVSGAPSAAVIFSTVQDDDNYSISHTLVNTVDRPPSIYSMIVIQKNVDGFRILFSGNLDSDNYRLDWAAIR